MELVKNDHKIKRFYFIPGVLSVVFFTVILVYQVLYTYVVLLGKKDEAFEQIIQFVHSDYITSILIVSGIFLLVYVLLIPIFEGALIRYVALKDSGEASRSDSLWYGIYRFAPLFEYNNIFNIFKFVSILNGYLFTLRFLGIEYLSILTIGFTIAFLLSIIMNIFIAYARYEIILNNKWAFEAVSVSSQIALLNIKTTLKLYFLMFIMNIKVVLNFIVFLTFPLIAIFIAWVVTSQFFSIIAYSLLIIIFLFFLALLAYLNAVLDVFRTTIWYQAYKVGKKNLLASQED